MDIKAFWDLHVDFADATQHVFRDRCGLWRVDLGSVLNTVCRTKHWDWRGLGLTNFCERRFQTVLVVGSSLIGFFLGNITTTNECVDIEPTSRGLIGDQVVHAWLGHRWVVTLVVATTTVGDQIQYNIAVETLAVFEGQLCCVHYCFWVITVDMEDRCLNGTGNVSSIRRGT